MMFAALINNISFIIALSIFYRFIIQRWEHRSRTGQVASGVLFGAVAVIGMMNPVIVAPGLIFDGRSIMISIAGFIGGWLTAVIAALMAIGYRVWLGGTGATMGVLVIASAAAVGVAYHYLRRHRPGLVSPWHLIGFGIIVHICMLAMTMALPPGVRHEVLARIAMPVMLIYPLGTLLVCFLLLDQESRIGAEEALRESEERYRHIVETSLEGIWTLNADFQTTYLNQRMADMLGYTPEEILGKGVTSFVFPEDMDDYNARAEARRVGADEVFERRFRRKDGTAIWSIVSSAALFDREKQFAGSFSMFTDITERKQAEEALRDAAHEWLDSFNAMSDGVSIHDRDYKITRANHALCQLLGKREDELVGKHCFTLFHGTNCPIAGCPIEQTRQTGNYRHEEFFEATLNKWLSVSSSPVLNDAGELIRIVHIVRDITDHRRAEDEKRMLEERLQRSEKMEALGSLAGGVAHDLNNILGVLSGYSEILVEQLSGEDQLKQYAANILKSSEKGAVIIQDLLTLARRGVVVNDIVDLNAVIGDYLSTPQFDKLKAYHLQVTIKTELEQGLLHIMGSAVHLEKAVMNLVSNAAEAIVGEGEVCIRTENRYLDHTISGYDRVTEGDYVVLTVSDTGGGIARFELEKIFEPFYTKKVMGRSGTGLGLAIVWGTVKDHRGYIDVRSIEGQGTAFLLYFPITREPMAERVEKIPVEQYRGKGESILVIDDVEEQRQVATTLLTQLGYQVNSVAGGQEAIAYLQSNTADILVLDMIMDRMDGLDTFKLIREINPQQKAVIVSGFSETDRAMEAQQLGAGAYVKKPYLKEKIGLAVRSVLDR